MTGEHEITELGRHAQLDQLRRIECPNKGAGPFRLDMWYIADGMTDDAGMYECRCGERLVVRKDWHEAYLFFYEHAGWSYNPETQTPEDGRRRCAMNLAAAERRLHQGPYYWDATPDDHPWDGDVPWDGPVWTVTLYSVTDTVEPVILGAIGGVGAPGGDPYLRVVAAELADEHISTGR